jgi:uncharacterized protein YkwD
MSLAVRSRELRLLSRSLIAAVLVVSVLGTVGLGAPPASAAVTARHQMLALTNRSRADHGVRRLKLNPRLSRKATRHSRAMASKGTLYHTTNVPRELRPWHWTTWGENVGMTSGTLSGLQEAFMNSPVHRTNILNGKFRHVGIGVARSGGAYWVTLTFYG